MVKRFDVVRLKPIRGRKGLAPDYALILQVNVLSELPTVVAAPLVAEGPPAALDVVTPNLSVNGKDHMLLTYMIGAIGRDRIIETVANMADHSYEITRAMDRLFSGV